MSKLFKLKEWLTIPDAARHLSGICGEPVSNADVLRLGLDGHLKLSIHLVNKAHARLGTLVPIEQARTTIFPGIGKKWDMETSHQLSKLPRLTAGSDMQELPAEIIDGLKSGSLICAITDLNVDDEQYLHLEDHVASIDGVWDLPMIGAERLDVEHLFQQETDGPEVTLVQLNGVFLTGVNGEWAQLQERFDSPEMQSLQEDIKQTLQDLGVKRVLKIGENKKPFDHPDNWFRAGALPKDGVLVVRTSALAEFQSQIIDGPTRESSQSTREKNSLLRIIGLMANHRYAGDIEKPYAIASHLAGKARELDVKISDDAIAKHLKAALELLKSEKH